MAGSSSVSDDSVIKSGYWPSYRNDVLPPASIDTNFFTHLFYAFIIPSSDTYELIVSDEDATLMTDFTTTLHNKDPPVKTLLSIGGGIIPDKNVFATIASDANSRSSFINSAIDVARKYGFDGMDLDWEYPKTDDEMDNFGYLLQEWRAAIVTEAEASSKTPLLLTGAVYYAATTYDSVKYPIESVVNNMDWINLMTYDYHGSWESPTRTGEHTALHDPNSNANTDYGLKSWMQSGVPSEKLVLGLAMYGRVWNLTDINDNGINAPATVGDPEELTFAEILEFNETKNSTVVYDEVTVSVYAYAGSEWVGYDDEESIKNKVIYGRDNGLRGYFFWEIGQDSNWRLSQAASNA